uniref:ATP synthase F(0) complex subunit f, mitochondrial n=2 Tax=Sus scrofa TaxID=9823 RepID=A0A4X1SZQ5_PIG
RARVLGIKETRESKMALVVAPKDKLLDVKTGELPSWILMWHLTPLTPKGIVGAFQDITTDVKKGRVAGLSVVLAAYVLFNYCSYKEFKYEEPCQCH